MIICGKTIGFCSSNQTATNSLAAAAPKVSGFLGLSITDFPLIHLQLIFRTLFFTLYIKSRLPGPLKPSHGSPSRILKQISWSGLFSGLVDAGQRNLPLRHLAEDVHMIHSERKNVFYRYSKPCTYLYFLHRENTSYTFCWEIHDSNTIQEKQWK